MIQFRFVSVLIVAAAVAAAFGASESVAQDAHLSGARADLEAAAGLLQASPYAYGGHRDKALQHIRKALEEVHRAEVEPYPGGREGKQERKQEKRELKLERKREKREEHLERKEQQRDEELEERNH